MKVNHIKQLFVALSLLLSAGTATAAQWKLAKTNLNAAGSKDTLTLEVSGNSFSFSSFQVDFTLSEGILLDGTPILGELAMIMLLRGVSKVTAASVAWYTVQETRI